MSIRTTKTAKRAEPRFAICLENTDCPASLELHKVYRVLRDDDAEQYGDLRVVDESGEDYLYPASYFVLVDVPEKRARALSRSLVRSVR